MVWSLLFKCFYEKGLAGWSGLSMLPHSLRSSVLESNPGIAEVTHIKSPYK